jgi:cytochrome bd-type quinol oxidase subunit 2
MGPPDADRAANPRHACPPARAWVATAVLVSRDAGAGAAARFWTKVPRRDARATAAGMFPLLLPSTLAPDLALAAANAAGGEHGLRVGVVWWTIGMSLAVAYGVVALRGLRGRVAVDPEKESP